MLRTKRQGRSPCWSPPQRWGKTAAGSVVTAAPALGRWTYDVYFMTGPSARAPSRRRRRGAYTVPPS
jgi:hypothetical protein